MLYRVDEGVVAGLLIPQGSSLWRGLVGPDYITKKYFVAICHAKMKKDDDDPLKFGTKKQLFFFLLSSSSK